MRDVTLDSDVASVVSSVEVIDGAELQAAVASIERSDQVATHQLLVEPVLSALPGTCNTIDKYTECRQLLT